MPDLNLREYAIIVPLIVLMVWMGTFTQSFIPSDFGIQRRPARAHRRPARCARPQVMPPCTPTARYSAKELANAR